jgi:hypothetical protein
MRDNFESKYLRWAATCVANSEPSSSAPIIQSLNSTLKEQEVQLRYLSVNHFRKHPITERGYKNVYSINFIFDTIFCLDIPN